MKKLWFIIGCSFLAHSVFAQENCPTLKTNQTGASVAIYREYVFGEHQFKDGQIELVISETRKISLLDFAQVTFNRNPAKARCFFTPIAFVQGGLRENYWGWHMLWSEGLSDGKTGGLLYARMDAEAWVSSNPKKLTKLTAVNPQFKLDNQTITITWQQVENGASANLQAVSSDEGRSWDISNAPP